VTGRSTNLPHKGDSSNEGLRPLAAVKTQVAQRWGNTVPKKLNEVGEKLTDVASRSATVVAGSKSDG